MIYLSIGHHPDKPGACHNGFCEFDEAKIWAELIASHMQDDALLVPVGTLKEKVKFINSRQPKAAIEVHFNSAENRENVSGCETLYYPGSSKGEQLANELQSSMVITIEKDRGIKPGYYRLNPANGVNFFLKNTKCPSLIIEPEFVFNKETIQKSRIETCKNIANALINSLEWL